MTTKREDALAGSIKGRAKAFDIECNETNDDDIEKLYHDFERTISYVRSNKKLYCQIVNTYRLAAHSLYAEVALQEKVIRKIKEYNLFS